MLRLGRKLQGFLREKKNRILLLMTVAMLLSYLPWYNFSAVMSYVARDLGLSSQQLGMILSVFQAGYVAVVLFTGWLADRIGDRRVVSWATLSVAVFSTSLAFFARGFASTAVLRLLNGFSAGAIYVPGMAFLSRWFPPGERGKVMGTYTAGLTLASGGGYFIAAPAAAAYGWRAGLLLTSLPAFIAAYLVFFLLEDPPPEVYSKEPSAGDDTPAEVRTAPEGGWAGPLAISSGYLGHMWELYAFWGWIGPFMTASALQVGYGRVQAVSLGGSLATLIIVSGAPAVYLMGRVADRWGRTATILLCSSCSLSAQFVLGFLYGRSLALVTLVGFWIGFWAVADSGVYKAGLTEMVSPRMRGTALGMQSAAGFAVTIAAPYVFGVLLSVGNPGVDDPVGAEHWGLPFAALGAGALLAPLSAIILGRLKQARLMTRPRD